ncbi:MULTISPECIES: endonuclease/exonuclease/phosphatase family protein [Streptomyces]|uniref:endonuclease/exonuclease/phosphatase family protein n=1 Tax=Streptomyces TaxID=1883 RepID=UPI0007C7EBB6|nr:MULTISPECIES: endonuclease/exonuclease/phosphatase family protein [Streptomyces]
MSGTPLRFVVCSLNLWRTRNWPARSHPLAAFLRGHRPDVLVVQELSPEVRSVIDVALDSHDRVTDAFPGWSRESNIYWHRGLFEPVAHGREDIGQPQAERGLYWVRLRRCGEPAEDVVVATAHYTWPGHPEELRSGVSPRPAEARATVTALARIAPAPQAVVFAGDLNDFFHPLRVLREAGLADSFSALGRMPRPTIPSVPAAGGIPSVADWMLHRGPVRPMSTEAVDFFADGLPPSDHKPLLTTYSLERT